MTPSDPSHNDALRSRIAGFCGTSLAGAMNGLTSAGFQVTTVAGAEAEKPQAPLVWKQSFSLADGAIFWLAAGRDLWEAVGEMILGGAGVDSVTEQDCRSTWNEISAQTMGGIAQALTADLGREVQALGGEEDGEDPGDHLPGAFLEITDGTQIWRVRIYWSAQFAQACSSAVEKPEARAPVTRETVKSRTLDLLLDVALPVSVSFGRTSLQIREVLKLNTGSVVELDRLVSEPVEVIVNNCVIARGEVVVVDGNYGVRVIQLASREDRLRSGVNEANARLGMAAR
jgi:flagellar motor switch protein FliN/FliY